MLVSDSVIQALVNQVRSIAHRNYFQPTDVLTALQAPAFEDFLTSTNLGVALYIQSGHFFYVSKSLSRMLGYPIETVYAKGPDLLQHLTTLHDRPLVASVIAKTTEALKHLPHTVSYPRISFDYHIVSGNGALKRVYQHLLPNAVAHKKAFYTLYILHDFTGFKTTPSLSYRLSYLSTAENFITLAQGSVSPACPYSFTKSETHLLQQLALGKSMAQISTEKKISIPTLKKHRGNMLRKTRSENMVALIREGLQGGWIAASEVVATKN